MLAQNELQNFFAHITQGRGIREDFHAFLRSGAAGQRISAHTLNLDNAHPATAESTEILMRAERWNIDIVQFRGPKHSATFGERNGTVVKLHFKCPGIL